MQRESGSFEKIFSFSFLLMWLPMGTSQSGNPIIFWQSDGWQNTSCGQQPNNNNNHDDRDKQEEHLRVIGQQPAILAIRPG